jgi:hypothetical protein
MLLASAEAPLLLASAEAPLLLASAEAPLLLASAQAPPALHPWRRNVDFLECAEPPIRPLIEQLDFIEDKSRWGYKFRFGVFKIDGHDLEVLRSAMTG